MRGIRSVCWDSCVFYAWIKDEVSSYGPEAIDRIGEVAREIEAGRLKLVVSIMVRVEVFRGKITPEQKELFDRFLMRTSIEKVAVDTRISDLAEQIRADSLQEFGLAVGIADSVHLATAISRNVTEFQTMEKKKNKNKTLALKRLDGHKIVRGLPIKVPRLPSSGYDDMFHHDE